MRLFPREAWSYAVLLVVLFSIGTIAVWHTLSYLEQHVSASELGVVTIMMWSLTLGFMLIAGAFGLWAIRFSADAESRRRIGRFVDAMHFLHDGLLVLDRRGRVTGSNPAAAPLLTSELTKNQPLREAFPCLSEDDVEALLDTKEPNEVERLLNARDSSRSLRFRSYPSEDLTLVLISDVTAMNVRRLRSRQAARLQLIGQIARGVAHDFNNLLCAISGHAALAARVEPGSAAMMKSVTAINRSAEKGVLLAGHLLELSQSPVTGRSTGMIKEHIKIVAEILGYTLPSGWRVAYSVDEELPAVGLSRMQFEQLMINVGLLAADTLDRPGVLRMTASRPGPEPPLDVGEGYAGVILVSASPAESPEDRGPSTGTSGEAGVIESVVSSMLAEAGGSFHRTWTEDGTPIFRVALPHGYVGAAKDGAGELPEELKSYITQWTVLLALPQRELEPLRRRLDRLPLNVEEVDDIMSALGRVDREAGLDAVIMEYSLLGRQPKALLKAILKLRPSVGLVVLCEDPESDSQGLTTDIVFESAQASPDKILAAMVDAKSLAARRETR